MHIILFMIIISRSGLCNKHHEVQQGSDVTFRCDVPLLSESSTLQWIKDTGQTSNTTFVYNNSAYIILYNVDENSEGKYHCLSIKAGVKTVISNTSVNVRPYSHNTKLTIYRQSSSHSDLSLICKSKKKYHRLMWTWHSRAHSKTILVAVEKGGSVQVKGPVKPGRKTSTTYDSQTFILHISPVKFNYSGIYRCIVDDKNPPYTITTLRTIRVSTEPPAGVLNQSVVLTCEVSDVSDSVMLVWLMMQRNRGVLVKQEILNETNKKKRLRVNVNSLQSDLLHWQCAVFTENILRAVAPITISLISSPTHAPRTSAEIFTSSDQDTWIQQDSHIQTVILMACAITVLIVLGFLVFKCQRKSFTRDVPTEIEMRPYINTCQTDSVRTGRNPGLESGEKEEEVHYASVTVAAGSRGANS